MSYQRAIVNCLRCYQIASEHKHAEHRRKPIIRDIHDDQLYAARNEAMEALEEAGRACLDAAAKLDVPIKKQIQKFAKALDACQKCDYSDPKIADLIFK